MADSEGNPPTEGTQSRTDKGVPATGEVVPDRFSSDEVFQRIVADADHEITSGVRELFFSGVAAGFAITITVLLYATMSTKTDSSIVAALLYPIGFVYIIIGGYQLYTENTLPPVALTLERLASIPALLRHWSIVLAGNFVGGIGGAIALAYGGVFSPEAATVAVDLAEKGIATPMWDLFFKAAFAGLIVAGVVWINFAAQDTISRLVAVYIAFLAIPLGDLFHVVVSFTEVIYLLFVGDIAFLAGMWNFVIPVLLGNTLGGVLLVTVVNYYQTSDRRLEVERFEHVRRLTPREWFLGNLAGRSYVPIVDTVEDIVRDPDTFRVLVPIANPRTETELLRLACAVADSRKNGIVHVVHIVQAPERMTGGAQAKRITAESEKRLEDLERQTADYDVTYESSTIVSSRSFEEVFDRARRTRPDLVVMGWGSDRLWNSARAERPIAELTNELPCDFLVMKDEDIDPSRILIPTAGGPDSDLSAEVAQALQTTVGSELELLHVVSGEHRRLDGEKFLTKWATDHELADVTKTVDTSGDIESAIERAAEGNTIVMLGATERGMISRLLSDSLHLKVADEVDASVLLAERPSERSLIERLFGRGRRRKKR